MTTATLQCSRNEISGGEAYNGLVQVTSSTSHSVCKFLKLRIWSEYSLAPQMNYTVGFVEQHSVPEIKHKNLRIAPIGVGEAFPAFTWGS